jgi:hypothetical protein
MRGLQIVWAPALAASCLCMMIPARAETPASPPQQESASLEVRFWGKLVVFWRVDRNGTGEVWRVPQGGPMFQYDIRKHHLTLDSAAQARLAAVLERMKQATRREVACKLVMTDMYYGEVVWNNGTGRQVYKFNYGCRSRAADRIFAMMASARDIVEKQAAVEAEPFAVEHVMPAN